MYSPLSISGETVNVIFFIPGIIILRQIIFVAVIIEAHGIYNIGIGVKIISAFSFCFQRMGDQPVYFFIIYFAVNHPAHQFYGKLLKQLCIPTLSHTSITIKRLKQPVSFHRYRSRTASCPQTDGPCMA